MLDMHVYLSICICKFCFIRWFDLFNKIPFVNLGKGNGVLSDMIVYFGNVRGGKIKEIKMVEEFVVQETGWEEGRS